jgi:uncharacterized protein (DUF736 family)
MAVIGAFCRAKDGGWQGTIRTLSNTVKARFVPNDDRRSDLAPDFHVVSAQCDLGAAWVRRKADNTEYLSVHLDGPTLIQPISAALFYSAGELTASLIWTRRQKGDANE